MSRVDALPQAVGLFPLPLGGTGTGGGGGGGGGRTGGGGGCPDAFAGGALDVFVPTLICQKLVVKLN